MASGMVTVAPGTTIVVNAPAVSRKPSASTVLLAGLKSPMIWPASFMPVGNVPVALGENGPASLAPGTAKAVLLTKPCSNRIGSEVVSP